MATYMYMYKMYCVPLDLYLISTISVFLLQVEHSSRVSAAAQGPNTNLSL